MKLRTQALQGAKQAGAIIGAGGVLGHRRTHDNLAGRSVELIKDQACDGETVRVANKQKIITHLVTLTGNLLCNLE